MKDIHESFEDCVKLGSSTAQNLAYLVRFVTKDTSRCRRPALDNKVLRLIVILHGPLFGIRPTAH